MQPSTVEMKQYNRYTSLMYLLYCFISTVDGCI